MDGMLYPWQGDWCDDDASDYDDEYLPFHREDVLFDLDSNGWRPIAAELAPLAWPHSCWWHDRDRIVLLYMHMLDNPPDGSYPSFGRLACFGRCAVSGQTAGTAPTRPRSATGTTRGGATGIDKGGGGGDA